VALHCIAFLYRSKFKAEFTTSNVHLTLVEFAYLFFVASATKKTK